jgi:hypothetical protein
VIIPPYRLTIIRIKYCPVVMDNRHRDKRDEEVIYCRVQCCITRLKFRLYSMYDRMVIHNTNIS